MVLNRHIHNYIDTYIVLTRYIRHYIDIHMVLYRHILNIRKKKIIINFTNNEITYRLYLYL